jgi:hypothetical protein
MRPGRSRQKKRNGENMQMEVMCSKFNKIVKGIKTLETKNIVWYDAILCRAEIKKERKKKKTRRLIEVTFAGKGNGEMEVDYKDEDCWLSNNWREL